MAAINLDINDIALELGLRRMEFLTLEKRLRELEPEPTPDGAAVEPDEPDEPTKLRLPRRPKTPETEEGPPDAA